MSLAELQTIAPCGSSINYHVTLLMPNAGSVCWLLYDTNETRLKLVNALLSDGAVIVTKRFGRYLVVPNNHSTLPRPCCVAQSSVATLVHFCVDVTDLNVALKRTDENTAVCVAF